MKMKLMTKYSIHVILVSSFFSLTNGILNRLFEVPDRCENEIVGIESFYERFFARYHSSPVFFIGSLHDVCEEGINSHLIEEVRIVHLHHISIRDFSFFSVVPSWSTFISTRPFSVISSVRNCSVQKWSSIIWWIIISFGHGISHWIPIEKCKSSTIMERCTIEYLHENRLKRKWKERIFVEQVRLLPMKP